jgi:hypothetical protein
MIVVDSSTWIDYFNGAARPHAIRLDDALRDEEDLATLPIVVAEVLQGIRSDPEFAGAQAILEAFPIIHPTLKSHVRAAQLHRALRRRGITVRGIIDCIIAETCLELEAQLLSPDADFERIARHTSLQLWRQ